MARILIEEKDSAEAAKMAKKAKHREATSLVPNILVSLVLVLVLLGLIAIVLSFILKVSRKTKETQQGTTATTPSATGTESGGVSIPKSAPGVPLPGIGGGVSAGAGTSRNPASAPASPENMILIPEGEYVKSRDENGNPAEKIHISAFYIDKYEVTNRQYYDFVTATGHKIPNDPRGAKYNIWLNGTYPSELADHPVVNVTYQDAVDYAAWAGKRLPREEEWEYTAGGDQYNPNFTQNQRKR